MECTLELGRYDNALITSFASFVVVKFEHRAAHAKRVRSRHLLSQTRLVTDLALGDSDVVVDVTCYKADGC